MTLQVVWDIERREQRKKIALYSSPTAQKSVFTKRSSIRSRRVKVWTKEEVEKHNVSRFEGGAK